ncbi:thiopeptide-type bacteriocin biosynthesis protein [Streptomyces sp. NPDC001793]|uniref:thiopeptide-type bacteriocin biosynthesis protein n=1 Tax=Streptomyces sp. NPDC001793 TaxID=3154657 RepID=UPI0033237081
MNKVLDDVLQGTDWWYARLYPGGVDRLDVAVATCLPPLAELAAAEGADRWFFIQYTDWRGPHLRLRVHGPRRALDALHRRLPQIARDCEAIGRQAAPARSYLFPLDTRPFSGRHSGADAAVYEPEDTKYGGPAGTRLAEEVFQHSSELALWACTRDRLPDRAAIAVLLLAASAASLPQTTSQPHFWDRHLVWWTQEAGTSAETLRTRLHNDAEQDRRGIREHIPSLAADPAVQRRLKEWTSTLASYLAEAERMEIPRSPGHLIFHQAHMMTNRLGILPREEALLGIVARAVEGGEL